MARTPEEEGKLIVQVYDTLAGVQRRILVDMVVLAAALEPRKDAKSVGQLFGIACGMDGWMVERHPKIDPVATMTEGIFIAGCAQGPKGQFLPRSITEPQRRRGLSPASSKTAGVGAYPCHCE